MVKLLRQEQKATGQGVSGQWDSTREVLLAEGMQYAIHGNTVTM